MHDTCYVCVFSYERAYAALEPRSIVMYLDWPPVWASDRGVF